MEHRPGWLLAPAGLAGLARGPKKVSRAEVTALVSVVGGLTPVDDAVGDRPESVPDRTQIALSGLRLQSLPACSIRVFLFEDLRDQTRRRSQAELACYLF